MLPDIFYRRTVALTLDWMDASLSISISATEEAHVLVMAIAGQKS